MTFEKNRLEITTNHIVDIVDSGFVFTGVPVSDYDEDGNMSWYFKDVEDWEYNAISLKDIAAVRKVGESEYAYIAEDYQLAKAI